MSARNQRTVKHRGKVYDGSDATQGQEFNLNAPAAFAVGLAGEVIERNEPRPGTTRYPISREEFYQLKAESVTAEQLAKNNSTIVGDEQAARVEIAGAALDSEAGPSAFIPFAAPPPAAYPTPSTNFAGISATGWLPPDCTMAVGPSHVLVSVNSSVAIYQKNGAVALATRSLTSWFSNVIQDATVFDPKALYDQHANRWILIAVAVNNATRGSWFLISVSRTADPLQGWLNYSLDAKADGNTTTNNWADYPALGVDTQALYLTANMFRFNGGFQYSKIRIIPKTALYQGGAVTFKDLVRLRDANGGLAFTVQPCHTYGAPQAQYFVNSYFPGTGAAENKLSVWTLTNPLGNPALQLRTVTVDPYNLPPDAVQQNSATPLETGDVRVLNAVFRGGSIWCAFNTRHSWENNVNEAAVHWFQIEAATGVLIQQGIYGGRGAAYFYPAVMPDNNGNMMMVFSRSGANEFASIHFTGRKASDALGTLRPSSLLLSGAGAYLGLDGSGRNRWGDYAGIASDPASSGLIWFYSMSATAGNQWNTWIGSAF